jgi:hypothetical protein
MARIKNAKTPPEIIVNIIKAGMGAEEITVNELAKRTGFHTNTVYSDFRDPGKMTQQRLWLYFAAVGIPISDALKVFADQLAAKLTDRG